MIKFLTILSIFIVLLNEIDAKSLDTPSKVPQRDGYEPFGIPPMDREIGEPTSGGPGEPKDRKTKEPSQGGNAPWGNNCWTKPC